MEEEFQYTNKFLRDNKGFILSLFGREVEESEMAELNNGQKKAVYFFCYVKSVLDITFCIICTLNNDRLKRTATEKTFWEIQNSSAYILAQDFLHSKELAEFICRFITVDALKKYLISTIKSYPEYQQSNNTLLSYARHWDDRLTSDISPYKFLEIVVFGYWYMFQTGDNEYTVLDEEVRNAYYHSQFKSISWLACLEYSVKQDCTEEQFYQTIDNIVEDYTEIENSEAKEIAHNCLLVFSIILKHFVEQDSKWIETDEREDFCGVLIPKEQTEEERRIEVAADYLVEYHYIAESNKELFVNIMNNRCPSGKIQFLHGVSKKDKIRPKEKGGKAVLYWILLYIREPLTFYGQKKSSFNYEGDTSHFFFLNKEEVLEWRKIKDTGYKNKTLGEEIKNSFQEKEAKR